MIPLILVFLLVFNPNISAHEDHHTSIENEIGEGRPTSWVQWIGSFHLIFLHFPIALINMVTFSELLFAWREKALFEFSARFMLLAAAILALPTALLGLVYSTSASYSGLMETFLRWHMWCGIATTILSATLVFVREYFGRCTLYFLGLSVLFLLVNITGFLGGGISFGPYQMLPPL